MQGKDCNLYIGKRITACRTIEQELDVIEDAHNKPRTLEAVQETQRQADTLFPLQ